MGCYIMGRTNNSASSMRMGFVSWKLFGYLFMVITEPMTAELQHNASISLKSIKYPS